MRFAIVNPYLWMTQPLLVIGFAGFSLFWASLVDYTSGSFRDWLPFFGGFSILWIVSGLWGRYRSTDSRRNFVELGQHSLFVQCNGQSYDISRDNVRSYSIVPAAYPLESFMNGLGWRPAGRHFDIELKEKIPWSFKAQSVIAQWGTKTLSLELKDEPGFEKALTQWIGESEPSPLS